MSPPENRIPWSDRDAGEKLSMVMIVVIVASVLGLSLWVFTEKAIEGNKIAIALLVLWGVVAIRAIVSRMRNNAG